MKIFTHNSNDQNHNLFIEVEVNLIPGLPRLSLIGLPDVSLKEGALRIKSALLSQGFEWPRAKEIIVNLKPADYKKYNNNVELAILVGILQATGQIHLDEFGNEKDSLLVLGDLDLSGRVHLSSNTATRFFKKWPAKILAARSSQQSFFNHIQISKIADLKNRQWKFYQAPNIDQYIKRPKFDERLSWTRKEARILSLLALSEVSVLIAGPQGSGKTSLAKEVWKFLMSPIENDYEEICLRSEKTMSWRPLVCPHHSIPRISLLGGGVPLRLGEVFRAHKGLLILDELLEFKKDSLEVLREALQGEDIELSRAGRVIKLKTQFQTIATTNLCPCGRWAGGERFVNCSRSLQHCKGYLERLSGPIQDRFAILWVKNYSQEPKALSSLEVFKNLDLARDFRKTRLAWREEQGMCSYLRSSQDLIYKRLKSSWMKDLYSFDGLSERRKQAFWQVADHLADLDGSLKIHEEHLSEAYALTCNDFRTLS